MTACHRISPNDGHYFFAYYDKLQFCPQDRWVLMQRAEFWDRQPRADDVLRVGMVDRQSDWQWTEIGQTTAWCWQQGCMLQWVPGTASKVIYNVRGPSNYESLLVDVVSGEKQALPRAIYCLHPAGDEAISLDFARIGHTRPGYGYEGIADPNREVLAPNDRGLWTINLKNGESTMLYSIAAIAKINPNPETEGAMHWFNHALYNPSGSRFIFLHRFKNNNRRHTRMYTCDRDGGNLFQISDSSIVGSWHASHFWWQDDNTIMMWGESYDKDGGVYLTVKDGATTSTQTLDRAQLPTDGHMSFHPNGEGRWLLSDNYPNRVTNHRDLFLFDVKNSKRHDLGSFEAGPYSAYDPKTQTMRCDLHPRWSRGGDLITFDSVHEGYRGVYLADVSRVINTHA